MLVNLFVGNLSWNVGDSELEDVFRPHGQVQSTRVITDRDTGRSRGFGFVEIETKDAAALIKATNGQEVHGRAIRVNEAEERRSGGSSGGGGSGGSRRNNREFGGSRDRDYGGNREFGSAARRSSRGSRSRY